MLNKKGLSDIIATVLIILLALAAVVIVWQFVRPTIESGGRNINLGQACLQTEAIPVKCDSSTGVITAQLKQGSPFSIVGIVETSTGTRYISEVSGSGVSALSTVNLPKSTTLVNLPIPDNSKGKVAVYVQDAASGEKRACDESTVVVTCT